MPDKAWRDREEQNHRSTASPRALEQTHQRHPLASQAVTMMEVESGEHLGDDQRKTVVDNGRRQRSPSDHIYTSVR